MCKIVVLDAYTENPGDLSWEGLRDLGELTVYDRTPAADVVSRVGDADIVYVNKVPLTAETFAACPSVRFAGVLATGYNIVDVKAARERGVTVCNVPAYGTGAVGQFAIALLLEICHHIGHHHRAVLEGKWERCPDFCFWDYPLIELAGKTMGV
ncbi:MAG: D-2-hydroxyacid dehydrogenase, partial [Spirochaetaceae bacterium]|nr:D-2-hydroxyacid dehydrogenase [Spirochaetaceae bacterium]